MDKSRLLWRSLCAGSPTTRSFSNTARKPQQPWICTSCLHRQQRPLKPSTFLRPRQRQHQPQHQHQQRRHQTNPADEPGFTSIVDHPPTIIRSGRRHNRWGLLVLAAIPLTSFALGCWQVQRLGWKTALIAKFEDRLVRAPLPLPPRVDPAAVRDFDYRRVYARGRWRHDQEMLIGPRLLDGEDGFLVITPLERTDAEMGMEAAEQSSSSSDRRSSSSSSSTILVCRGWIPKDKAAKRARSAESLPAGEVVVQGLLREPWKKNMFTPANRPAENRWYFPDVFEMAAHTGSQPVWIEETMTPDLLVSYDRRSKGIPIGRAAEVNLRNNHTQYIFTWFSLCAATTVMLWMVIKRPPGGVSRRIRQNKEW